MWLLTSLLLIWIFFVFRFRLFDYDVSSCGSLCFSYLLISLLTFFIKFERNPAIVSTNFLSVSFSHFLLELLLWGCDIVDGFSHSKVSFFSPIFFLSIAHTGYAQWTWLQLYWFVLLSVKIHYWAYLANLSFWLFYFQFQYLFLLVCILQIISLH